VSRNVQNKQCVFSPRDRNPTSGNASASQDLKQNSVYSGLSWISGAGRKKRSNSESQTVCIQSTGSELAEWTVMEGRKNEVQQCVFSRARSLRYFSFNSCYKNKK